jgi:uncharacterized protein YbaA (DUF1428 family)
MTRGGWIEFESSDRRDAVRFDIMGDPPRFVRIRDRSQDDPRLGRAYIVVDLMTKRVLSDQTTYRPKNGTKKG